MTGLNLVDSSGWIEFLLDTDRAPLFLDPIMDHENLIVPTVSIYEVVKRIRRDTGEKDAVTALNAMVKGSVVDLDLSLAMDAARHNLPMADSIIYATAQRYGATLWTQDEDFETLPNVRYFAK